MIRILPQFSKRVAMAGVGCRVRIHGIPDLASQSIQGNSHQFAGIFITSAVNACQNKIVQFGSQVNGKIRQATLLRKFVVITRMNMHPQLQSLFVKIHLILWPRPGEARQTPLIQRKHRIRQGSRSMQSMESIICASAGGIVTVCGRIFLNYFSPTLSGSLLF